MITDLNKILVEWAYRTNNGQPNSENSAHVIILEKVLNDFGWYREAIDELLNNLMEAEADVVEPTLAKAREKAKLGQTYSSPRSKKVYTRGKEEEEGEEDDEKDLDKEKGDEPIDREKVLDGLEDDEGKPLSEIQKQKLKDSQDTALNYLRLDINDPGREKGMKGKVISEETHAAHVKCADILEKIWGGKEVSDDDKAFLSKWVAVVEPSESSPKMWRMYIAREPGKDGEGNFNRLRGMPADKLGGKEGFGANKQTKAMQSWMQQQGIRTVRTSTYAGKLSTAAQIYAGEDRKVKKLKKIDPKGKPKPVKRNEEGKVKSVRISKNLTLLRVPKKENETNAERKKRQQNNAQLEEYGTLIEKGELEFIDMDSGVNPDSAENRVTIIKEGLKGMADRLDSLGKRVIPGVPKGPNNPPPVDPEAQNIIDRIKTLSEKDPNKNPEEWIKELDKIMVDMEGHETLGLAFANIAEVYSAIKTMHGDGKGTEKGSATYLPESTTLETVDVLIVTQSGEGKNKIVTIDGISVKKGAGGASQLTAKAKKSGFKKVKDLSAKEVREKVIALSRKHEGIYDNEKVYEENPPSKESVKKETEHQEKLKTEIKNDAAELGVEPAYMDYIEKKMHERKKDKKGKEKPSQIESAVAGIMKIRKEEGLPVDPEIEAMMTKRMENYYLYQAMSHRAYNKNVEWQGFANDSFAVKKGEMTISESDGVDKLAWPRFEFNLGFSATGRSSNAGGGRFHNSLYDDPAWEKWNK